MKKSCTLSALSKPAADPGLWLLEPGLTFLNHGSFGSCPRAVLEFQRELQERMERQPCDFFVRELEGMLDQAREELGKFVGASRDDLVFVINATAGVNTVLRALQFRRGDELLVTNHEYNACRNALDFRAKQCGARVVVAEIPFPIKKSNEAVDAVLGRVSSRTRLVLLDHISSQTGMVFPIGHVASELSKRGVEMLVDGAHAPGMVPLNVRELGVTYYTGNCHKWVCAPKGAAFLYVAPERQKFVRPLAVSHGANSARKDRTPFQIEFGWTGTWDPSAYLSVPEALRYMGALLAGGWPEVMKRNRALTLAARKLLCEALGIGIPCPDDMIGSLASLPIPDQVEEQVQTSPLYADAQQDLLRRKFGIEVPIIPWPEPPKRLLRISCQLYNSLSDYERLAAALRIIFKDK